MTWRVTQLLDINIFVTPLINESLWWIFVCHHSAASHVCDMMCDMTFPWNTYVWLVLFTSRSHGNAEFSLLDLRESWLSCFTQVWHNSFIFTHMCDTTLARLRGCMCACACGGVCVCACVWVVCRLKFAGYLWDTTQSTLEHMCVMTHSYAHMHRSYLARLIHMRHDSVTVYMWDTTHTIYVRHDSLMIYMWDTTLTVYVKHDTVMRVKFHSNACDISQYCVWHFTVMRVKFHSNASDISQYCVWHFGYYFWCIPANATYGVASVSRIDKITGLFCKKAL